MLLKFVIEVEANEDTDIIGVKECFATDCEKYGDVKRIEVEEV